MTLLSVFLLLLCLHICSCDDKKANLEEKLFTKDANGCEITKFAIEKMEKTHVFKKKHNDMFIRAALVSKFGTEIFVNGGVGIWQMKKLHLEQAKKGARNLKIRWTLLDKLCFDIINSTVSDLKKPIVNAVVVFILLENNGLSEAPLSFEIEKQKSFWLQITGFGNKVGNKFVEAVYILDRDQGDMGTECLMCKQKPTDLIVGFDESRSIVGR